MNRLIQRLINIDNVLLVSYYKSFNIRVALELANSLQNAGYKVCIKNLSTFYIPIEIRCEEGSKKLILEAESESDLEDEFKLATSYKILKNAKYIVKANKLRQNIFKVEISGESFLLRVLDDKILDEELGEVEKFVMRLLDEWNGVGKLKDVINIVSYKTNSSKDIVRDKLGFLKDIGVIEIEDGIVKIKRLAKK